MKHLLHCAGKAGSIGDKFNVQESKAKYWGTCHNIENYRDADGQWKFRPRKFKRSDGSLTVDKTHGWHSRPGHKETLRNANRAINKRARQILKRNMMHEID